MSTPDTSYREIPLTQGQVARVSPHRYEYLNQWKWCAWWSKCNSSYYATRTVRFGPRSLNKKEKIYMHRLILGLEYGDKRTGDHKDLDTLNNLDDNLRIADRSEQNCNQSIRKDNTSGHKGISLVKRTGKLHVYIHFRGKATHLGYFKPDQIEEAIKVRDAALAKLHGEFARKS